MKVNILLGICVTGWVKNAAVFEIKKGPKSLECIGNSVLAIAGSAVLMKRLSK